MTFDQLWDKLCEKKPGLSSTPDTTIEITGSNLRKLLRQFYDKGRDQERLVSQSRDGLRSALDDILG